MKKTTKLFYFTFLFLASYTSLFAQTNQTETFKGLQYLKIENHWKQYDDVENKYLDVIESEITIKFNLTADSSSIANFENQYNLLHYKD